MTVKILKMTEEMDFVLTFGSEGSRGGEKEKVVSPVTKTQRSKNVQNLQNIKSPPVILSCNIHVDTTETSFSRVLVSNLAVNGLEQPTMEGGLLSRLTR